MDKNIEYYFNFCCKLEQKNAKLKEENENLKSYIKERFDMDAKELAKYILESKKNG